MVSVLLLLLNILVNLFLLGIKVRKWIKSCRTLPIVECPNGTCSYIIPTIPVDGSLIPFALSLFLYQNSLNAKKKINCWIFLSQFWNKCITQTCNKNWMAWRKKKCSHGELAKDYQLSLNVSTTFGLNQQKKNILWIGLIYAFSNLKVNGEK